MTTIHTPLRIALMATLALSVGARADEVAESRLREQLRQTVTEMRQLQDDNTDLRIKLQAAEKQVAAPATAAPAELAELQAALDAQTSAADALRRQLTELLAAQERERQSSAAALAEAKQQQSEAKRFETLFGEREGALTACRNDNAELVTISRELLQKYRNKGVFSTLRDKEPLLGLQRVKLENLAQDYHHRIIDATVPPAAAEATLNHADGAARADASAAPGG
jgi:chromosome segregation ATPase